MFNRRDLPHPVVYHRDLVGRVAPWAMTGEGPPGDGCALPRPAGVPAVPLATKVEQKFGFVKPVPLRHPCRGWIESWATGIGSEGLTGTRRIESGRGLGTDRRLDRESPWC